MAQGTNLAKMPEALEIAPKADAQDTVFRRLLKRSLFAVTGVLGLIVLISVIPARETSFGDAVSSANVRDDSTVSYTHLTLPTKA